MTIDIILTELELLPGITRLYLTEDVLQVGVYRQAQEAMSAKWNPGDPVAG
ncbi:hypothetical protein FRC14_007942 [Serendipita sp. 396]|nr:hypothetical protein FRC14_007942 [Serendipita sp. 396]